HHHEKGLLKGIRDAPDLPEQLVKAFFDKLRQFERMERRSLDADGNAPQSSGRIRVGKQVVCKQRMKVEDRETVEADFLGIAYKKRDRVLVIEDHLRFQAVLALRFLAKVDEPPRVEERVGVALEAARIPGEVDQQPAEDLLGIGAGRLWRDLRR